MKLNLTKGGRGVDLCKLFENMEPRETPLFDTDEEHCRAMDKIASLVNVRERTAKECRSRLRDAGFESDVADRAVESALRCGLVDDRRYAAALIKGKVHQGWGRRKILMRLEEDGVSHADVAACSDLFASPDEEYERAMYELRKRSAHSKNPRATLTRRLLQKGYSAELATRAVSDFMAHTD